MIDERITAEVGVCLVGGGHVCAEVLAKALKFAPVLIAADGGADAALNAGQKPSAIIGDFDSISDTAKTQLDAVRTIHVSEQSSTDFEKSLRLIDAPFVVGVGFTGKRSDHTLAAMSVLARKVGPPTVLFDEHDVTFAPEKKVQLPLEEGSRFSLFPMTYVTGRSVGLRWPIDEIQFAPNGFIGTSNEVTGPVSLEFDGTGMLIILPSNALSAVIPLLEG